MAFVLVAEPPLDTPRQPRRQNPEGDDELSSGLAPWPLGSAGRLRGDRTVGRATAWQGAWFPSGSRTSEGLLGPWKKTARENRAGVTAPRTPTVRLQRTF